MHKHDQGCICVHMRTYTQECVCVCVCVCTRARVWVRARLSWNELYALFHLDERALNTPKGLAQSRAFDLQMIDYV